MGFDEESDSEVNNLDILHPDIEIEENKPKVALLESHLLLQAMTRRRQAPCHNETYHRE